MSAATTTTQPAYANLLPGDPAPWFKQRSPSNPRFSFDSIAGRYVVLCFFMTAGNPRGQAAFDAALANRDLLDDERACFFGVSIDPVDEAQGRVAQHVPGVRLFWDFDGTISHLYGAAPLGEAIGAGPVRIRQIWVVLDPMLRVLKVEPFAADGSDAERVFAFLRGLPEPSRFAGFEIPAPVLILPNVFEPSLCDHLIGLYEQAGGQESGFMREIDGKTVAVSDRSFKSRKDYTVEDPELIKQLQSRIVRRVNPEIRKVHHFRATRMERYIVSCYAAEDGGHFQPHRDNTTKGTAHRRYAVSINLNADFDGGEVSFPEYGPRSYKAPPGGAVVFSAPLLHAVSQVTRGRRFAFLPFLYDEEAAKIREANNAFLDGAVGAYKAGWQPPQG